MMKLIEQTKLRYLKFICGLQIWQDQHGQDLVEYALMAGFVAVAAGVSMPSVSSSVSKIFSRTASVMTAAAS